MRTFLLSRKEEPNQSEHQRGRAGIHRSRQGYAHRLCPWVSSQPLHVGTSGPILIGSVQGRHRGLRGHGESDAPLWLYTMDQFADDVKGLLDHLSIQQAVLAGFSMGGYVVFAFYRKYAARVNGLVLADTRPQPDSAEGRAGRFKTAQTAHRDGAGAIADIMLPKLLSP